VDVKNQLITDQYAIYNADTMAVLPKLPDASVHLSCYSPPFGGMLYQYSSDPADLSNSKDYAEFFEQYGFFVREIHRLTLPGRITAVHCTDLFRSMGDDHSIIDFPGDIVRCHEANGWKWFARIHIWKEPLTVRNRTMIKSLHHATLVKDSTKVSIANSDYILAFRRSGKNPIPVSHPRGLMNYAGIGKGENMAMPDEKGLAEAIEFRGHKGNQIENAYSQWIWRQYASPNWYDIRTDNTLGSGASMYSGNKAEKEESDEKHMHPLQLDVIERCVVLWSNPGETVLTPFLGVGSEVYQAVKLGRKGIGIELKEAYYRQAIKNLESIDTSEAAEAELVETATLFGTTTEPEEANEKPTKKRKKTTASK
jgi:DNA modification methylase